MAICAKCGAGLNEGAAFCGSCGAPVAAGAAGTAAPSAATSEGLASNVAGALAYFTIIPAIIFLVAEPYNRDKFVRFHAFQSLFLAVAFISFSFALAIVTAIPFVGWVVGLVLWPLFGLTILAVLILSMYKAYNHQKFMLPVIGKLAAQQAG